MKKLSLVIVILSQFLNSSAQSPRLIFGNSTNLSIINYDPDIVVVKYGSGTTATDIDLNLDGNADISLNLDRKLTALYESAYITFPNAAAQVALNMSDDLTVIGFKQGDSLYINDYSFDFDETAFDGAILYVSNGPNKYGQFTNNTFKYLAFRITSTDTLYGWLRLSKVNDFNTDSLAFRVDQLAYEGQLTDIFAVSSLNNIHVFPTITTGSIHIEHPAFAEPEIVVYSLTGKLMMKKTLAFQKEVLNLDTLPDGMYLLVVSSGAGKKTFKVVKQ